MAAQWAAQPSRANQRLTLGGGVEHRWSACEVPWHAWVMSCWKKKQKRTDQSVLVTPDRKLNASWIVRHDEERPEMAQDYAQMKSGGWQLPKLRATRASAVVL